MFKKLDRLIIRTFLGPFFATFFITLLVLIIQFFWLYIDDFVGKGLDGKTILEFITYQSAALVPLALPLAILLSSLMTFGQLGETSELVAIKSAGISLLRFMRPLFVLCGFIAIGAFLFSNYVIPVANLKSRTLLGDIIFAKPAFDLKEGVFYDKINGYAIKIGKKEADSIIYDIIIYEQNNPLQDNMIVARKGIMRISPNRRFLEFHLRDGWRYQERGDLYNRNETEFIRIAFREFKKSFDLSHLGLSFRTADSVHKNSEKMLSMRQLEKAIDSMKKEAQQQVEINRLNFISGFRFLEYLDKAAADTMNVKGPPAFSSFDKWLPDSVRTLVAENVKTNIRSGAINLESLALNNDYRLREIRKFKIEWHRKVVLSVACLVLFLIGAPLGSIIRKGGLGTPLIFAILFFMVFYFTGTTGEKFAKENSFTPFAGMWLSTFVLLPIGLFLTYKALHDSRLLDKEFYFRAGRFIKSRVRRIFPFR
ncbi:MAG: LptF/LptG family permease [Chitinophagaceae bacterium]|nr:LptF/LptG family permease [Chitinophagaceae bacterium]